MAQKTKVTIKTKHQFRTLEKTKKVDIAGNALEIFKRRYALKDENGKPRESVEESMMRVASHVAKGEERPELVKIYTDHFYNFLATKRFIPNTPTWSGAGTPLGQLAACFVLPIKDEMGKEDGGIFQTLRDAALIQQTGGGNGFSFSRLRPKGDRVKTSNGVASGPVSFLEAYDESFGKIAQGGTRRGANMAVLRVDHPDVYDFIKCKSAEGKISNFNISVAITDKFMKAVKEGKNFDLINPRDGKVWKTVDARELFNEIIKYAHKNGEPGCLFIDEANRHNPVPNQYVLEATNPCGEQWLGPYENCCLGHVNIDASVKNGKVDWEHLKERVVLGTRFLDDVVTQNAYVPSVPRLKEAANENRRIGLGFLGLADAMYKLGIRYGSKDSLDFSSQVVEFIRFHSMKTSIELAEEKGAFPGIKGSIYDPENLAWKEPRPLVEHKLSLGRPALNWSSITKSLKEFGVRNSTQTTIAPTGTTSTVLDVEGYGCEPVFALAYYRNVYQSAGGEENLKLTYVSPSFQKALDVSNLGDDRKKEIIEEAINKGTIQHVRDLPEDIRNTFVVSADITPEEHVMVQATLQRFIDNSISKTCNFPAGATVEDVKKAYITAWELGCKGLTVYVTGSRQEVVLETKETAEKKKNSNEDAFSEQWVGPKRPRPDVVHGRTHLVVTPFGKAFVTVNRNGAGGENPFEVFVTIGKAGSDISAVAEALGRLISGWLRSAKDPYIVLEEIADDLKGIGGSSSTGFGVSRVRSLPDAVAKVLVKELELGNKLVQNGSKDLVKSESSSTNVAEKSVFETNLFKNASVCNNCGNMTLIETEGCQKCLSCGYSKC